MLPGLWFELFGAHCSGGGTQLPNHPCAYLLPDWPEEESHWLPVCIIQPSCFCLSPFQTSQLLKKNKKHSSCNAVPSATSPPVSASKASQISAFFCFLWGSISLKITFIAYFSYSFKLIPANHPFFLLLRCQWLNQVPKHLWSILHRLIIDCMLK